MARRPPVADRQTLPDGSKLERKYRTTDAGGREPYGNWLWVVYNPDRRPSRKRVNLYTRDLSAAFKKALDLVGKRATGAFDPWEHAAPDQAVTVAGASGLYLAWKRKRGASAATVESDRGHLDRLARFLPPDALLRHVEPRHVEAFLARPKHGGGTRSASAQARSLATLQHFFAWAVERGHAAESPTRRVSPPKTERKRRDHLTEAEQSALIGAISDGAQHWLRDWVVFGVGTGLRPGEQRQLCWSAVRLDEGVVEVGRGHAVKTAGSRRVVPVAGEALQVLKAREAARSGRADGPVFTGAGGEAVNVAYLSKVLRQLAERGGVRKTITAYSLRHSYGTRHALAGTPIYVVAQLMGTSVAMIERHYGHFDPARGAAHVERVFGTGAAAG